MKPNQNIKTKTNKQSKYQTKNTIHKNTQTNQDKQKQNKHTHKKQPLKPTRTKQNQ